MFKKNVLIYGATGSIGGSTLNLIRKNKSFFGYTFKYPTYIEGLNYIRDNFI